MNVRQYWQGVLSEMGAMVLMRDIPTMAKYATAAEEKAAEAAVHAARSARAPLPNAARAATLPGLALLLLGVLPLVALMVIIHLSLSGAVVSAGALAALVYAGMWLVIIEHPDWLNF